MLSSKRLLSSILIIFAVVMVQLASPTVVLAAGTVGTGTAGSCTEAALDTALSGGGSVTFNCGAAPITITVTITKTISSDTQINGGGLVTLSGGNTVRIFAVESPATLSLTNITLTNGNSGNAQGGAIIINSGASANITNSTFSTNTSGFVSVVAGGGGAIYNAGTLTVTGSTFSGNSATGSAGDGGAIMSNGAVTITNSTFFNNSAVTENGTGGAMRLDGGAGPNTITHVTLSNNANDATFGALDIVDTNATLSLSILANSATGVDCTKRNGGTLTSTNNLIESGTGCTAASTADPGLGGLQNNGGPTQTMAITETSPAYNFTASCLLSVDQRGVSRPQPAAGNCDLGAYEFVDGTIPTVGMSSAAPNPTNTSPIPVTVQFSEAVTGFVAGDIIPGNGTVSNFVAVDGDTYTFNLNPTGQGLVTADIAAGVATDSGGNGNTAATQFSRTFDTVAPVVTIGSPSVTSTSTGPVSFPITVAGANTINLTAGNITLNKTSTANGTVSVSNGTTASPTVTISSITGNGTIGISIAVSIASDAAGNTSAAVGPSATFIVGESAPGAATLNTPSGNIVSNNPTYTWDQVLNASYYYLWVDGPGGHVFHQWYTSFEANCNGSTCSVAGATPNLSAGSHTWYVQTWNSLGYGPWSAGMNFTISPPGQATLVGPSGSIGTNNPTYTWNQVNGATWYYLWVNGPSGNVFNQWYSSAQANCTSGTCSVTPPTSLSGGAHIWYVQTWSSAGYGPWSDGMSFTPPTPTPPAAATLNTPSGSIGINNPTYIWNQVTGATYYYLWIDGPGGHVFDKWFTAAEAGCNGSTCSATLPITLSSGSHTWWVQTWNNVGYGPWSDGKAFTVSPPAAATLVSPTGSVTNNPTYTWNQVPGATYYYLWIDGPGGHVFDKWYTAAEAACNGSTCSVAGATPSLAAGSHTWWVQTWSPVGYGPWSSGSNFTISP